LTEGQIVFFAGTEHQTRRCPRRLLLDNPDVTGALALWRACDGKPGIDALRSLSSHAVDAFAVIDAGRAAKIKSDSDDDERNRKAEAAARGGR
jgi:hypothetical protein